MWSTIKRGWEGDGGHRVKDGGEEVRLPFADSIRVGPTNLLWLCYLRHHSYVLTRLHLACGPHSTHLCFFFFFNLPPTPLFWIFSTPRGTAQSSPAPPAADLVFFFFDFFGKIKLLKSHFLREKLMFATNFILKFIYFLLTYFF